MFVIYYTNGVYYLQRTNQLLMRYIQGFFLMSFLFVDRRIIILMCFQMRSVDGTPIGQFLVSKNDEKVRHLKCQSDQVGF